MLWVYALSYLHFPCPVPPLWVSFSSFQWAFVSGSVRFDFLVSGKRQVFLGDDGSEEGEYGMVFLEDPFLLQLFFDIFRPLWGRL